MLGNEEIRFYHVFLYRRSMKTQSKFQKKLIFLIHNKKLNVIISAISKSHQYISNRKKVIQIFMVQGFHHVFFMQKIHENVVKISKKSNFFITQQSPINLSLITKMFLRFICIVFIRGDALKPGQKFLKNQIFFITFFMLIAFIRAHF